MKTLKLKVFFEALFRLGLLQNLRSMALHRVKVGMIQISQCGHAEGKACKWEFHVVKDCKEVNRGFNGAVQG